MFQSKAKKTGLIFVLGAAGITVFTVILSFFIWLSHASAPLEKPGKPESIVEIRRGSALNRVLEELETKKFIRSARAGKIQAFLKGYRLKTGHYALSASMGLNEILTLFHTGREMTLRLTFPEGLHSGEYADILRKRGLLKQADEFLSEIKNPVFLKQFAIPFDSAEGFLFPSTYEFPLSFSGAQMAKKMVSVFFEKAGKAFADLSPEQKKTVLIMASIVEKEAVTDAERPKIASVFYNRISKKMMLESCATVIYAFEMQGIQKNRLLYKDLEIASPYNTYRRAGLPPAPICNPGEKSIKAALNPEESPYLYFVYQGGGSHIFSTNLQDHMKAYRKYILYQNKRKNS